MKNKSSLEEQLFKLKTSLTVSDAVRPDPSVSNAGETRESEIANRSEPRKLFSSDTGNCASLATLNSGVDALYECTRRYLRGLESTYYQCDRCDKWHVKNSGEGDYRDSCPLCTSAQGKPKKIFETAELAQHFAQNLRIESGVSFRHYFCPHGNGWHLTKSDSGIRQVTPSSENLHGVRVKDVVQVENTPHRGGERKLFYRCIECNYGYGNVDAHAPCAMCGSKGKYTGPYQS